MLVYGDGLDGANEGSAGGGGEGAGGFGTALGEGGAVAVMEMYVRGDEVE